VDDPFVGQLINGKYRIVAPIGHGGMGSIYRAEQLPLGRAVALKMVRNQGGVKEADPAFQRRFFLEASLCAKLSHPNIVTIYDYGRIENSAEESYFMAMEFLEGETLHQRLRTRGGMLSPSETLSLALEIARGLREAHKHGIVHRDLKPGNVMIVPDEEQREKVKIVDFGLVKEVEKNDTEDLTQEGSFLGSPKYMAPEQIEHTQIDHRTDLYSLGVMMFQCLSGKVPFEGQSTMQTLLGHVSQPVPALKERNPDCSVPQSVERLVRKLLEKKTENRPASADELVREIRELRESLGYSSGSQSHSSQFRSGVMPPETLPVDPSGSLVAASMPRPLTGDSSRPAGKSKLVPILAAIGATSFLLVGGFIIVGRASPQPTQAPHEQTYSLALDTLPSGAVVSENGRELGVTPLVVSLASEQTAPRRFTLERPGYRSATYSQEPVRANTRVQIPLVMGSSSENSGNSPQTGQNTNQPSTSTSSQTEPQNNPETPENQPTTPGPSNRPGTRPVVRPRPRPIGNPVNPVTTPPPVQTNPPGGHSDIRIER